MQNIFGSRHCEKKNAKCIRNASRRRGNNPERAIATMVWFVRELCLMYVYMFFYIICTYIVWYERILILTYKLKKIIVIYWYFAFCVRMFCEANNRSVLYGIFFKEYKHIIGRYMYVMVYKGLYIYKYIYLTYIKWVFS